MHVSIIIPLYNEEESLLLLTQQLTAVLSRLKKTFEIIFVDDGSEDRSFALLKKLARRYSFIHVIRFWRNFGQTAAIEAGLQKSKGKWIVVMDADLQNDPSDIPRLLDKLHQGYDVVSGWRKDRKDPFFSRRLPSYLANKLISIITGLTLRDYGCMLKGYRREALDSLSLYGEMHRFLPALAYWQGARIVEIEVVHHPRRFGKSKYGLMRIGKVILDLVTVKFLGSYITKPIYAFGGLGLLLLFLGLVVTVYLTYAKLAFAGFYIIQSPLLLVAALLIILGVMFILMGLLAEISVRIYFESRGKKPYTIRETVG